MSSEAECPAELNRKHVRRSNNIKTNRDLNIIEKYVKRFNSLETNKEPKYYRNKDKVVHKNVSQGCN